MSEELTDELNQIYSKQIEREDNLIAQRLTLLLTFQGFLFASLSLLGRPDANQEIIGALKQVVPLMGIAISILAVFGIHAAVHNLNRLKDEWTALNSSKKYPAPFCEPRTPYPSLYIYGIPVVSTLAWLFLSSNLH
jgi:hypothetical protein